METKPESKAQVLQYIIEEVDAAREVYQLYQQLQKALPIKSFKDLQKACDGNGMIHFRDEQAGLDIFEGIIPEFIFPIEDDKGLIVRLAQFVKILPAEIGYDNTKPENIKRSIQKNFLGSMSGNYKFNLIPAGAGLLSNTELIKEASNNFGNKR